MQTLRRKNSPCKFKNEPTRFLGEGVSFKAKLIGILEVSEARGDRMCQAALADLKMAIRAAGEHKQRITVQISIDGLRLRDEKTGDCQYHHPVHKISFIAQDMSDSRAFGYIFGSPDMGHRFFGIKTDKAASQVVIAMRDLFQVVFELKKKEIELAKQHIEQTTIKFHPSGIFVEPSPDTKQGIRQMDKITPDNPRPTEDPFDADPFGDSFANMKVKDNVQPILPPPPSSKKSHLDRQQSVQQTSTSSSSSPVTTVTSKSPPPYGSTHWFDKETEDLFTDGELSNLSRNLTYDKDKDSDSSTPRSYYKIQQVDVFTELDPLGTGSKKPYVDKKDFFQHLKNPPKKVLKDLATTSSSDTFPADFKMSNINEPIEPVKVQNSSSNSDNYDDNSFANFEKFNEEETSPRTSSPLLKKETSPRNNYQPLSVSLPPEEERQQKNFPSTSILTKMDRDSTESTQGLIKLPSPRKYLQYSRKDYGMDSRTQSMDKSFPIDFSGADSPASPLKSCSSEASRLSNSSVEMDVPEPPPRGSGSILINPPPLPPKKQSSRGVIKPPPRPPYSEGHFHYDFLEREEASPSPTRKERKSPTKSRFDDNFSPPMPQLPKRSEQSTLSDSSFEDSFSSIIPPSLSTLFQTTSGSQANSPNNDDNVKKGKPPLYITLSQLTSSNLSELANSLNMSIDQLTNLTLQQLTECLADLSVKEAKNQKIPTPVSEKPSKTTKMVETAFISEPLFKATFEQDSFDSTFDKYAVFRELLQTDQEKNGNSSIDTEISDELKQDDAIDILKLKNLTVKLPPVGGERKGPETPEDEVRFSESEAFRAEKKLSRDSSRDSEEGTEWGNEQAFEKGTERSTVRWTERWTGKNTEKGTERGIERGTEKGTERGIEKVTERGIEKGTERVNEKGTERNNERGTERETERGTEKSTERDVTSQKDGRYRDIVKDTNEEEQRARYAERNLENKFETSDKESSPNGGSGEGSGPENLETPDKIEIKQSTSTSSDRYAALREIIDSSEQAPLEIELDSTNYITSPLKTSEIKISPPEFKRSSKSPSEFRKSPGEFRRSSSEFKKSPTEFKRQKSSSEFRKSPSDFKRSSPIRTTEIKSRTTEVVSPTRTTEVRESLIRTTEIKARTTEGKGRTTEVKARTTEVAASPTRATEVDLMSLFSDTPPKLPPKNNPKKVMDIFEEIKMLNVETPTLVNKTMAFEDIFCPLTETKNPKEKDEENWAKFDSNVVFSENHGSVGGTSPWSPDGKEFYKEPQRPAQRHSGESDNEWKDEEESEESNGRYREGFGRYPMYPGYEEGGYYEEGEQGDKERGSFRDKVGKKVRGGGVPWTKPGHRVHEQPWHEDARWEEERKRHLHRKIPYKDEEEYKAAYWKCRHKQRPWNGEREGFWPHDDPYYGEERNKRRLMLWNEERDSRERFSSQESMGYEDEERWSRREYERRRWEADGTFCRGMYGKHEPYYPREARHYDYPPAWEEDYVPDRTDDSPRYASRKRHWPKRPNSANDGRNQEVYCAGPPIYSMSRSECSDNDSDPYHRPHRSRSRDSYWGSDQEFDSWGERPYWSEGADAKNDSFHKRRINRHRTRVQAILSQNSPFEDDFTQPMERSEPSADSLNTESRTRVEVNIKKSPSPKNVKEPGKQGKNYKSSSYFEDDLTPTASASSDASDRPRLSSELKATPEELPSDITKETTDTFPNDETNSNRDSFFNGDQRFDDDAFTFRSELEDQISEEKSTLKNSRTNKYTSNKIKSDQYIKKSESVNIFARENDPFDDDEFFN
ncbi:protein disabled isoform X2 [Leptopilina heterotoma]|uniref:protein disabled isoform X2 n=1 Tax=Leptopilina heterotoma TaxID=63436 RepID=UPI001CA9D2F1|nr:protein disabled isoform X2 [Leptopilina heterotoma]